MRHTRFLLVLLAAALAVAGRAQMWDSLAVSPYRLDASQVGALRMEIDALTFFRDNEYTSRLTTGYSLPGMWVESKLVYTPHPMVEVEAGLHSLMYNGASKYPCYVYQTISQWKGVQYQQGGHILPWFRTKAQFRHLTLVLGNIYEAQTHGLVEPLFNAELNLSQDPESGFQLLWDLPRLHADTWLNWQSYIFRLDTHQEAFTVGGNWTVMLTRPGRRLSLSVPLQFVIDHRGGEQLVESQEVRTLCNGSLGARLDWQAGMRTLRHVGVEANALAFYQQSGTELPFSRGAAFHAATTVGLWQGLTVRAGAYRAPKRFVSLYGSPFFTTTSEKTGAYGTLGLTTATLRADYAYTIADRYVVGVEGEAFHSWLQGGQETNWSFGLYFRLNPSILIKRF